MDALQQFLTICGGISIIGGAFGVIWKVFRPAYALSKKVDDIESKQKNDFERMQDYDTKLNNFEEMQRAQSKCLLALLNHQITGNGIEEMKKIRDEIQQTIIEH